MPAGELLRRSWPTRATRAPVRATMRMISRGRRHCRRRVRPVKGGRARRMAILIRTSDVPAAQRHDAWRSVVCETLGPLDLRSDPGTPLRGEIEAGQLGPVNVGRVKTSTPHSVYRTPGLIRRDSPELYRRRRSHPRSRPPDPGDAAALRGAAGHRPRAAGILHRRLIAAEVAGRTPAWSPAFAAPRGVPQGAAWPGSRTPKPVAASLSSTRPGACKAATLAALSSSSWPSSAV